MDLDIAQHVLTMAPQDPDETTLLAKRAQYAAGKMHLLVSILAQRPAQARF